MKKKTIIYKGRPGEYAKVIGETGDKLKLSYRGEHSVWIVPKNECK